MAMFDVFLLMLLLGRRRGEPVTCPWSLPILKKKNKKEKATQPVKVRIGIPDPTPKGVKNLGMVRGQRAATQSAEVPSALAPAEGC